MFLSFQWANHAARLLVVKMWRRKYFYQRTKIILAISEWEQVGLNVESQMWDCLITCHHGNQITCDHVASVYLKLYATEQHLLFNSILLFYQLTELPTISNCTFRINVLNLPSFYLKKRAFSLLWQYDHTVDHHPPFLSSYLSWHLPDVIFLSFSCSCRSPLPSHPVITPSSPGDQQKNSWIAFHPEPSPTLISALRVDMCVSVGVLEQHVALPLTKWNALLELPD